MTNRLMPITHAKQLIKSGRSPSLPLTLVLPADAGEVYCHRVLRLLPGKRLTCQATWQDKPVVAKIFYAPWRWHFHAARDQRGVEAMLQAGIATPQLLYAGPAACPGVFVLLFEYIPDGKTFAECWYTLTDSTSKLSLLQQVNDLLVQLHRHGLCQSDLHLDNFLIAARGIFALDGADVIVREKKKSLPRKQSLTNLALFYAHLTVAHDTLRQTIFADYVAQRGWRLTTSLQQNIEQLIMRQRRRHRHNCLQKIYRECTAFICRKSLLAIQLWDRAHDSARLRELIAQPEQVLLAAQPALLKAGNTCTLLMTRVNHQDLVVKRYNIKSTTHWLTRCWRPSRAWGAWRNAHRLQLLGVLTPTPVALIEQRWGCLRGKAYFIYEYLQGRCADEYFAEFSHNSIVLQSLVPKIVALLENLYRARITHGDLKASNILIVNDEPALLDLDAMREHRFMAGFTRAWRRDMARFLRNWQQLPELQQLFITELSNKGLIV